jgi:hypothetical protein
MKTNQEDRLIEIYMGTDWQAGMVKSLLENEGIEAFLKDEIMGTLNPWWSSPGGVGAVKVVISSTDNGKAKEIVDQYNG